MRKHKLDRNGFAHTLIIIVFAFVFVVGIVGWRLLSASSHSEPQQTVENYLDDIISVIEDDISDYKTYSWPRYEQQTEYLDAQAMLVVFDEINLDELIVLIEKIEANGYPAERYEDDLTVRDSVERQLGYGNRDFLGFGSDIPGSNRQDAEYTEKYIFNRFTLYYYLEPGEVLPEYNRGPGYYKVETERPIQFALVVSEYADPDKL